MLWKRGCVLGLQVCGALALRVVALALKVVALALGVVAFLTSLTQSELYMTSFSKQTDIHKS